MQLVINIGFATWGNYYSYTDCFGFWVPAADLGKVMVIKWCKIPITPFT